VTSSPGLPDLAEGAVLPTRTFRLRRRDLARYAAASGDDNPIHLDDEAARAVGLPGVVAHGMLTMALAGQALSDWAGGSAAIVEYGVRFTKPVPVPDDDEGSELEVSGVVAERCDDGTVRINLRATYGGQPVLGMARARVTTQSRSGQTS
jgi:acyl dehydratase